MFAKEESSYYLHCNFSREISYFNAKIVADHSKKWK
jgi:hypothetical protein